MESLLNWRSYSCEKISEVQIKISNYSFFSVFSFISHNLKIITTILVLSGTPHEMVNGPCDRDVTGR